MPDLTKLSERQITELEAKRYAKVSANCTKLIAAGYGNTRHNEIVAAAKLPGADPLFVECVALHEAWQEVVSEIRYRKTYHGTAKPIPRRAA